MALLQRHLATRGVQTSWGAESAIYERQSSSWPTKSSSPCHGKYTHRLCPSISKMAPSVVDVPKDTVSHLPLKLSANGDKTNGDHAISTLELKDVAKTDFVLRTFRCLIADLCEQFKGGHPGYVSGIVRVFSQE